MTKHEDLAAIFEKKLITPYKREGVDFAKGDKAWEIAVHNEDIESSVKKLNMSHKPIKYMIVPKNKVETALETTEGSGIGVMSETGRIIKKARNK